MMNKQKINEKVFEVRLKHNLKKSSLRELQITAKCVQLELNRRFAPKVAKKWTH